MNEGPATSRHMIGKLEKNSRVVRRRPVLPIGRSSRIAPATITHHAIGAA